MTHNESLQVAWEAVCALPAQREVSDLRRERGYAIVRALPIEAMTRAISLITNCKAGSGGKKFPTKSAGVQHRSLEFSTRTVNELLDSARK